MNFRAKRGKNNYNMFKGESKSHNILKIHFTKNLMKP